MHTQVKASAPSKASSSVSASYEALKDKRAWDFAISPAKSLPMQAFMLYMSGGGVQIFSMGIVFMLLLSPFKNLAAINTGMCALYRLSMGIQVVGSIRTVRTSATGQEARAQPDRVDYTAFAEVRVPLVQSPHTWSRALEVSLHGSSAYGHRGLVSVRDTG